MTSRGSAGGALRVLASRSPAILPDFPLDKQLVDVHSEEGMLLGRLRHGLLAVFESCTD